MQNKSEIIIYQSSDGITKIDVKMNDETVWLNQSQISELFKRDRTVITKHIKNVFEEGELEEKSNVQIMHIANSDKPVKYYNLDVIISVGYRVKSLNGTHFRKWANEILKEYLIKGFSMNDEKLKGNSGGTYWKELLNRIRDIRSSEKVLYRQVLDLYSTSVDYDPNTEASITFFKIVQNKLHYAVHGNTAAEVIYNRADGNKVFMGLTTFKGEIPSINDVIIAKNYLSESELKILNNLVSGYFDLAEINAIEHKPMYMEDYIKQLDSILTLSNRKLLDNAGTISNKQAIEKAKDEYKKYQEITLSPVEKSYLDSINKIEKDIKK